MVTNFVALEKGNGKTGTRASALFSWVCQDRQERKSSNKECHRNAHRDREPDASLWQKQRSGVPVPPWATVILLYMIMPSVQWPPGYYSSQPRLSEYQKLVKSACMQTRLTRVRVRQRNFFCTLRFRTYLSVASSKYHIGVLYCIRVLTRIRTLKESCCVIVS